MGEGRLSNMLKQRSILFPRAIFQGAAPATRRQKPRDRRCWIECEWRSMGSAARHRQPYQKAI